MTEMTKSKVFFKTKTNKNDNLFLILNKYEKNI